MKRSSVLLFLTLLIMTDLVIIQCQPKGDICFSGRVVDQNDAPIEGARVTFGGKVRHKPVSTNKEGVFKICVSGSERFVLNITKLGYGMVSKVYTTSTADIEVAMEMATVVEGLDPTQEITITDEVPNQGRPAQPDLSRVSSPLDTLPFVYNAAGKLIAFGAPPEVNDAYEAIESFEPQQTGATVTVEADGLEEADEEKNTASLSQAEKRLGKVTGSVSTVDIYLPDGMPGDYSTRMSNGEGGYMVPYGAVDVNFYSNGKELQLKKGKFATLTIPVDTLKLIYKKKLPPTIPLLVYNKDTGEWERDGKNEGVLNKEGTAYVARVSHFSVFNMDEEFAAGVAVCYKICSRDARPAGSYPMGARIQITGDIPGHVKDLPFGTTLCSGDGGCPGGEAFAINNMLPNTPIGVRLFDGNTNQVVSSYVFVTDNSGYNTNNCSGDYDDCGGPVDVNWVSTPTYMNSDGTMKGPLLAIQKLGGVNEYTFTWVFIASGYTVDPVTNVLQNAFSYEYRLEYAEVSSTDTGWGDLTWNCVDLDGDPSSPADYDSPATQEWKITEDAIVVKDAVTPISGTVVFRVLYRKVGDPNYSNGVITSLDSLPGGWTDDGLESYPQVGAPANVVGTGCAEI